ncbi:MAG: hypothetical protein E7645_02790 [Ruminococcaceae bacterium]|nr:hypothetical protein [Oscillospiraceae bacterium]
MKQKSIRISKGPESIPGVTVSLIHPTVQKASLLYAAPLKRRAQAVLSFPKTENRLMLLLGLLAFISFGFVVPIMTDCLLLMGDLLNALSTEDRVIWWPMALTVVLNLLYFLLVTAPLGAGLFRMAVLMTETYVSAACEGMARGVHPGEILYPFTSADAYRRCLTVALQGLGWLLLTFLPSVLLVVSAVWWIPWLCQGLPVIVYVFLWVGVIGAALGSLVGLALWALRLSGYGYFVFARPDDDLGAIRRDFLSRQRTGSLPLWLLLGRILSCLVSMVALLLPLLPHALPLALLSWASYGRYLMDLSLENTECVSITDNALEF